MSTFNNENDYRVTRSRTKVPESENSVPVLPQDSSNLKPLEDASKTSKTSKTTVVSNSGRQHLRDVSRKFGIKTSADTIVSKKRPLGGETGPLTQKAGDLARAAKLVKQDSGDANFSENIVNSHLPLKNVSDLPKVPQRMPQKRQATESSTKLMEILHTSMEEDSSSKFKKSKKIDYVWQDLDEEDFNDPLMVSEYVNDIFPYLHELEKKTLPDPTYLYKHTQLKPRMRSILVDWLVEMHQRFRLLPETLFLAINIMDRFMSVEVVQIDKLQLLATGSLFIAAKYEEVFSPSVKNYAYYTDGSYTEAAILEAENYILTILEFDLSYPNPMNFLRRISKADDYDVQSRTLGKYLLEISLVDHHFIGILPSLCSAAAMYIARLILNKEYAWNGNLIHYSGGYKVEDMRECVGLILRYLEAPVEHDEFHKKYSARKFMRASLVCRSWAKKVISEGQDIFDKSLHTEKIPA